MEAQARPIQAITGDGKFEVEKLERFIKESEEMASCGASYNVVSIIGAQNSGKSHLLNSLFGTGFEVMNAKAQWKQTTQGIWISRCLRPCTIVMDMEGCNGCERGEDDLFEKQCALFALTVSNVVMVNMFLNSIRLHHGGGISLLKTVFQQRLKLPPSKTTILVIIRDYDYETPVDILKQRMQEQIVMEWELVHPKVSFNDYFMVQIVTLPHRRDINFLQEVGNLRRLYSEGDLTGIRQDSAPILGFPFSAQQLWNTILTDKKIDFSSHKVVVSNYECDKVVKEMFDSLPDDKNYTALKKSLQDGAQEFAEGLLMFLHSVLAEFDKKTISYDDGVRFSKRKDLESKIIKVVEPIYMIMLDKAREMHYVRSKREISSALEMAEIPSESVKKLVQACVDDFHKYCKDLLRLEMYAASFAQGSEMFVREITSFAKVEARRIEKKLIMIEVLKIAGSCTLAGVQTSVATLQFALFDPTSAITASTALGSLFCIIKPSVRLSKLVAAVSSQSDSPSNKKV